MQWKLNKPGGYPTTKKIINNSSLAFKKILKTLKTLYNKTFIPFNTKIKCNGDCSLMAERTVVVRKTGVRFSPFAYLNQTKGVRFLQNSGFEETKNFKRIFVEPPFAWKRGKYENKKHIICL